MRTATEIISTATVPQMTQQLVWFPDSPKRNAERSGNQTTHLATIPNLAGQED